MRAVPALSGGAVSLLPTSPPRRFEDMLVTMSARPPTGEQHNPTKEPQNVSSDSSMDAIEHAQMTGQHVFVVNGASDFLDMVRSLPEEERYNVTTTNFVPATFDQIAALQPSLIIMDLAIGVRAGWELLEHLAHAAGLRAILVIVVSTNQRYLETVEGDPARFGADRVLSKPFTRSIYRASPTIVT